MKKLKIILMIIAILTMFVIPCRADFGDYAGDSDFGGFDAGDFDTGGNDYDYGNDYDDDDDDYNYGGVGDIGNIGGSSGSGSSGISSGSAGTTVMAVIIVGIIVFVILRKSGVISKNGKGSKVIMPGAQRTDASTLRPVAEYQSLDPEFSEAEFSEKLSNMYVRFQNSWQAKNMEDLRPYLTDAFFAQCDRQLDAYRKNHQTNRIERISVLGVNLNGWKQENGNDVMIATLRTRIVDYVVDDETGALVRGSQTAEKFMEYEWTLQRTSGQLTGKASGVTVQSCPHCGAPVDINHSAVCEYCGSLLTSDTFDWAVSTIKGISQRTQ